MTMISFRTICVKCVSLNTFATCPAHGTESTRIRVGPRRG